MSATLSREWATAGAASTYGWMPSPAVCPSNRTPALARYWSEIVGRAGRSSNVPPRVPAAAGEGDPSTAATTVHTVSPHRIWTLIRAPLGRADPRLVGRTGA